MEIVLASQSPRRRELLERMGLRDFRVLAPAIDETEPDGTPPEVLVCGLSARKARAVARQIGPETLVLAADTVVALDRQILGKPKDGRDAERMLAALSGRTHQVYTGVTLRRGAREETRYEVTQVRFRTLCEEDIRRYVATGEPMDKAGAYGIQGYGALLVEEICGDYCNVVGLPVFRLGQMLNDFGVDCLRLAAEGS